MGIIFTEARTAAHSSPRIGAQTSSDETLVARIARGDTIAMRALFLRHQMRVYRFALRIVREEALAEDVLSEVFLDVWRQAGEFEVTCSGVDLVAGSGAEQSTFAAEASQRIRTR